MNNHDEDEEVKFITDGKDFYISFSAPLVSGYIPVPIPKIDPFLRWYGPKIDLISQWYPALKFMADHAEHEVVLRLFMNRERDHILIFPLTQIYGTGMSVKEEITTQEREDWAGAGLIEAGTIHSHCNMSAFQSGVDKNDEANRDGLHVTIGKLKSPGFDIHARMTWTLVGEERDGKLVRASQTLTHKPLLRDWFIMPPVVEDFIDAEPSLEDSIVRYMLTKPPANDVTYPKGWDDRLVIRQITSFKGQNAPLRWGESMMFGPDPHPTPSKPEDIPGYLKKKEENPEKRKRDPKADLIWDLWTEALSMIADQADLRTAQIAVTDFTPHRRGFLLQHYAGANEVWAGIEKMLRANNVTEEEFFADQSF
jgi:hypothetical protein